MCGLCTTYVVVSIVYQHPKCNIILYLFFLSYNSILRNQGNQYKNISIYKFNKLSMLQYGDLISLFLNNATSASSRFKTLFRG